MRDWNKHYQNGNPSGFGSIGAYRDWKWKIIEKYLDTIDNIVDVGCGDLSFWEGRDCELYTGIDVSQHIIDKNKTARPLWKFFTSPSGRIVHNIRGDIVFCFDMLFHLLDDNEYIRTLFNICLYSRKWLFIFTWHKNPFYTWKVRKALLVHKRWKDLLKSLTHRFVTDNEFQKYRDLASNISILNAMGFYLEAVEFPEFDKYGAMYIFKGGKT